MRYAMENPDVRFIIHRSLAGHQWIALRGQLDRRVPSQMQQPEINAHLPHSAGPRHKSRPEQLLAVAVESL